MEAHLPAEDLWSMSPLHLDCSSQISWRFVSFRKHRQWWFITIISLKDLSNVSSHKQVLNCHSLRKSYEWRHCNKNVSILIYFGWEKNVHVRDISLFTCEVTTLLGNKPLRLLKSMNLSHIRTSRFCVGLYNGKWINLHSDSLKPYEDLNMTSNIRECLNSVGFVSNYQKGCLHLSQ